MGCLDLVRSHPSSSTLSTCSQRRDLLFRRLLGISSVRSSMAVLMSKVYAVLVLTARRLIQVKTSTFWGVGEVCPLSGPC